MTSNSVQVAHTDVHKEHKTSGTKGDVDTEQSSPPRVSMRRAATKHHISYIDSGDAVMSNNLSKTLIPFDPSHAALQNFNPEAHPANLFFLPFFFLPCPLSRFLRRQDLRLQKSGLGENYLSCKSSVGGEIQQVILQIDICILKICL